MDARVVRAGVAGGVAGGAVMAVFSMMMLWLAGSGFWTPLNLIAHTFWRSAPLDGTFSAPALVIGMAVHLTMAMLFGTLIAAAAYRLPAARSLVIAGGMLFAAGLWAVMQYGIWRAIDAEAAQAFTPWVFAVAHLLFGMMAAFFAALWITDADTRYEPAHASRPGRGAAARPPAGLTAPGRGQGCATFWLCRLLTLPPPGLAAGPSASPGDEVQGPTGQGRNGMPRLRRTAGLGNRLSGQPGEGRFSWRARVIAGEVAALAVLAVLAVATLASSPHPARAASGTTEGAAGSRAATDGKGTGPGAPPGAQVYRGNENPNPSAHPNTIPGPAAPPVNRALTLGRPGAAVTIVEFGDYQCTNCGAFARDTEPALVRKYVDTGVVRLVWRDFPWVDAQSIAAAVAARAAGMQGKFWADHDYLFAHQSPDEHSGLVTGAYLQAVARRLGLNMALFGRDAASPALAAAVRADKAFGEGLGVPGTPAFLINGQPFFGAQPLPPFEAAIATARKGR